MWSIDRLSAEQQKQVNELLSKRIGGRAIVTREQAELIKSKIAQTIEKSATDTTKTDAATFAKALDAARDSMTKIGCRKS